VCRATLQLREKREELNKSIAADEEEKGASHMPVHAASMRVPTIYSFTWRWSITRRAPNSPLTRFPSLSLPNTAKIQNDLRILTERLARINDNLARKVSSRTEYDKTITETEAAYSKIMESSQTLLHVLKRESVNLTKKKEASSWGGTTCSGAYISPSCPALDALGLSRFGVRRSSLHAPLALPRAHGASLWHRP
jgi:hypothetical protein